MKYQYGATSKESIDDAIRIACTELSPRTAHRAIPMLRGTCIAETGYGTTRDNFFDEGAGIFQFDTIRYPETFRYARVRSGVADVFERNGFDLDGISTLPMRGYSVLMYCPLYSALMCRVAYMKITESLPEVNDDEARAGYWCRHWNKSGKGSEEHYLRELENHS